MAFLYGFILSVIIAGLALYKQSLNISGFIAAVLVGTAIYGFGTSIIFILLMVFFISSSILTKTKATKDEQGRNGIQVFANAGVTVLFCVGYYMTKNASFLVLSALSIAVSTSDTWASEIGKLARGKTISILDFKPIPKGASGGISLLGILASFIGALFIASIFVVLITLFKFDMSHVWLFFILITVGGFLGSIIDSYLGITIQEKYLELATGKIIEKVKTYMTVKRISGIKYINNDAVNFLTTLITTSIFSLLLLL